MATRTPYQTTFEPQHTIQPIYTGGTVALEQGGRILATTLGEDALLTDLNTGRQLARIEGDGEQISTLSLTPSGSHLIICSRSLSMRMYSLKSSAATSFSLDFQLLRTLKPHATPVVVLAVDQTSKILATGAADGIVKVWDISRGYITHTFKGSNVLVSALHFFEVSASTQDEESTILDHKQKEKRRRSQISVVESQKGRFKLAAGSRDGNVRIFDLKTGLHISVMDSHMSDVRAMDYSPEENTFLTASRDKTIIWWDVKTWRPQKIIPVLEEVEAAGFLQSGRFTYTGGQSGNVRIWQSKSGREVTQPQPSRAESAAILGAIHFSGLPFVLSVQADQTIVLHSTSVLKESMLTDSITSLKQTKKITGNHDEIIDLGFLLPDQSLLAMATNLEELRIVSIREGNDTTQSFNYFGADIAQLKGHEDIIVCLDIDWSGHWLATGAKDNTARLWKIDAKNSSFTCYATFTGHAESIGAICLPHAPPLQTSTAPNDPLDNPPEFLLTGSQDRTIKRWEIPNFQNILKKAPRAVYTRKAHDKDINAIDMSQKTQLFASASQDRTVKVWSFGEGEAAGVLRGHRRGVWSVKFAPKDVPIIMGENGNTSSRGFVLTGSGDKTVKIWSLADYTCLRTFEGHTTSVLKVAWLNVPPISDRGRKHVQVASAGGDGLLKVWDASTGELAVTLDNHEDRIWALAVHPKTNMLVSGSGDSTITFWKDTSSETRRAESEAVTKFVDQEQELDNHIYAGSYRSAITLALQLNHPQRLLGLFTSIVRKDSEEGSLCGMKALDEVLSAFSDIQIFNLLERLRDWNTNARTAPVAQKILGVLVKSHTANRLSNLNIQGGKREKIMKEIIDTLRVYTERHYKRTEEMIDESYLVEYTLRKMDGLEHYETDGI